MKKNDPFVDDAALKLHRTYLDVLRRRAGELRAFAERCLEGKLVEVEIENIHMRVRSLAGSGATYGHADISTAAEPLDRALGNPTSIGLKTLAALAGDLAAACEKVIDRPEPPAKNPLAAKSAPAETFFPRPVLLTVDDDPAIHDMVKAMFGDSVHTVAAYSGKEALDAARHHCPNIILLDNYMPGIDGLKLLEGMGDDKDLPPVPVVMLTADSRPREILRAAAAGAADYVTKPFEPPVLAEKINGLLRRARITVLIANGNPVMRELIINRLRRLGFNAVEAANGNETLALAAEHIPELILLDQSAPEMNGGEVLHALRRDKRTRHIPMLCLGANGLGQSVLENVNTGAVEQSVVPFVPEKITARIMDALGLETQ